jgi:hypothetical protein
MKPGLFLLLLCLPLFAQRPQVGVKAGIPLKCNYGYCAQFPPARRPVFGPAIEFRLTRSFAIGLEALYTRLSFDHSFYAFSASGTSIAYGSKTVANQWEFPVFLKYRFSGEHVRPFAVAGASWNRISKGSTAGDLCTSRSLGLSPSGSCGRFSNSPADYLENRTVAGFLWGAGIDVPVSRVRVSPEVRFTRRATSNFSGDPANLNELQLFLGLTF